MDFEELLRVEVLRIEGWRLGGYGSMEDGGWESICGSLDEEVGEDRETEER